MIRSLLKLAALLIAGILLYNYFLGTPTEKASSKKIFNEVKDVGVEIGNLLKSEKKKFDKGKYDNALEKIDGIFDDLRGKAREVDEKYLPAIEELQKTAKDLKKKVDRAGKDDSMMEKSKEQIDSLNDEMEDLLKRTQDLMKDMKLEE